jgi:P-type Cu2+ transporter
MKTSTINVSDMLSVLSVDEVEKRIGEVPGVESVTVNFAAENATVRYDETRLEATSIKSAVRQKSYEPNAPEQSEVMPVKDKVEVPATAPAVTPPPEEKDQTESMPPANEEKADEHTGHEMDEMPKD